MAIRILAVGGVASLSGGGEPGPASTSVLTVYRLVMRAVAQRPTPSRPPGGHAGGLLGAAVGLGFILVSTLLITLFGGYDFSWSDHGVLTVLVPLACVSAGGAVTEELLLRGIALQALEHKWGSRAAVTITAVLFGLLHLNNSGATLWSSIAIALEAGVLLGAAFLWRRSIWFVVGLHFIWNVTVGLLGIPVSGHESKRLLTAEATGSSALSGGSFGLEASVVPVIVGLLIAVPMLLAARHRGATVPKGGVRDQPSRHRLRAKDRKLISDPAVRSSGMAQAFRDALRSSRARDASVKDAALAAVLALFAFGPSFALHEALGSPATFGTMGIYFALYAAGAHQA